MLKIESPFLEEGSPKHARMSGTGASKSATNFLKLSVILLAWIPHTPNKFVTSVSEDDLTYLHNLPGADKMEFLFDVTFYT